VAHIAVTDVRRKIGNHVQSHPYLRITKKFLAPPSTLIEIRPPPQNINKTLELSISLLGKIDLIFKQWNFLLNDSAKIRLHPDVQIIRLPLFNASLTKTTADQPRRNG
jgi:hypothetical protein